MLRIQYDRMIKALYKLVDDEFELSTREGTEVFIALSRAMFELHPDVKRLKQHDEDYVQTFK